MQVRYKDYVCLFIHTYIAVNFAMLFVLGFQVFFEFLDAIKSHILNPYSWIGNHSIWSYLTYYTTHPSDVIPKIWFVGHTGSIKFSLMALTVVCIFINLF